MVGSVRKLSPWRVQQNYFYQNHQHIFVARAIYGSLDLLKYRICCFGDMFFSEKQYFPCHEVNSRFYAFISTQTHKVSWFLGWEVFLQPFLRFRLEIVSKKYLKTDI